MADHCLLRCTDLLVSPLTSIISQDQQNLQITSSAPITNQAKMFFSTKSVLFFVAALATANAAAVPAQPAFLETRVTAQDIKGCYDGAFTCANACNAVLQNEGYQCLKHEGGDSTCCVKL